MSPRDDETPRRGNQPRRGSSRVLTGDEPGDGREVRRGRTSIGDARAYTPRGRTVAERGRVPRDSGRNADPFRPALQVLDGGDGAPRATRGRGRATEQPPAQRDSEQPRARGCATR